MGRHSNGCRTCISRKVRCDETRPWCRRCVKLGQRCPGFSKPGSIIFVNETDQTRQKYRKFESTQMISFRSERHHFFDLHPQPGLAAFAPIIYQAFLLGRFVSTGVQYLDHNTNGEWMKMTLSEPNHYPLGSRALLVLAECFYGRQHHQDRIVSSSMQSYGHIIRQLRQSLTYPTLILSHDVLAAVIGLYYFECFAFTSNKAWLQHADALSNLIEALCPETFRHSPAKYMLESVREPLIAAAIVARKKTFLEDEVWKMGAGQYDIFTLHVAELNHIYAKIPHITQQILSLQTEASGGMINDRTISSVQHDIEKLHIRLEDWSQTWTSSYSQQMRKVTSLPLGSTKINSYPSAEVFDFDSLMIAKVFVNYWTIRTLAFIQTRKLKRIVNQRSRNLAHVDLDLQAGVMAVKICCSIPFFMQPVHIESAPFYLTVPIRVAYLALPPSSAEAQWLRTIRNVLADSTGVEILRNILSNVPMRNSGRE